MLSKDAELDICGKKYTRDRDFLRFGMQIYIFT